MKSARPRKPQRSDADATRSHLIEVSQELLAERGIDGVSVSDIIAASGQRNRSAVNYHFGGKDGLIEAILETHEAQIEIRRNEMIAGIEARGRASLRDWVRTLVMPLGELIDSPGGIAYLRIIAQLIGHPRFSVLERHREAVAAGTDGILRMLRKARQRDPALWLSKWILVSGVLYHGLADYAQMRQEAASSVPLQKPEEFFDELVESIAALIETTATTSKRAR
ncbi:MAG: TetR/AcrR family transcriptional regulator [bacterium]|jgi:AcrR family transcriptional regulator|nr:TetR/AcrR family transcriptional regulator [bacterium]